MTFSDFNDKLQTFASNINEQMGIVIEQNEKQLVQMNREQLRKGEDTEGQILEPPLRNYQYAKSKKERGGQAPFWIPDLFLTGAFQGGMIIEVEDRDYFITSTDEKTEKLSKRYKNIFGVGVQNELKAQAINTKQLADNLKKYTGLG